MTWAPPPPPGSPVPSTPSWGAAPGTATPPVGAPGPGFATRPRRPWFWPGVVAVAVAIVCGLTATGLVGYRVVTTFTRAERAVAPAVVTIGCEPGQVWRIGPRTASSDAFGPVTITQGGYAVVEDVRATEVGGAPLAVRPLPFDRSETLVVNGDEYTADHTFTCRSSGAVLVEVGGPEGQSFAVFSSFGGILRGWRVVVALLGTAAVLLVTGLVLAFTGRARRVPGGLVPPG